MEERNSASPIIALLYMWNFKGGKNSRYLVHYGKEDRIRKDLHPTDCTHTPPQRGEGLDPSASLVSHLYFPSSFLNRKECSLPFLFLFFFPFQSNVCFLIKSSRKFILSLKSKEMSSWNWAYIFLHTGLANEGTPIHSFNRSCNADQWWPSATLECGPPLPLYTPSI